MAVNQGAKVYWSPVRCQFMYLMKVAGSEGNPSIEVAKRIATGYTREGSPRGLKL